MKALGREWLDRTYEYHVDNWLWGKWGYARGWSSRLPEMLVWYATAGASGGSDEMADTMVKRVRRGRLEALPRRRRRTWKDATALAEELCVRLATNPVDWFTGGSGSIEASWRRLDEVAGIGPKIASFFLRDLSFFRDYSDGSGGTEVVYRKRRSRLWFEALPSRDQALFVPIDMWVHSQARQHGASRIIARGPVATIQSDADLHRRAGQEIVRWARARGFDPRDVDTYWYELGTGNVHEDGCECTAE